MGDAFDLAQVGRDVLAGLAVAPGGAQDEGPIAVNQAHGEAVDLQLGHHAEGLAVQQVGDPAVPCLQVIPARRRWPGSAWDGMLDLGEAVGGAAADDLGGRACRAELGMGGFQLAQFLHQRVVLAVADDGGIVIVVALVVEPEPVAEPAGALDRGWRRGRDRALRCSSAMSCC